MTEIVHDYPPIYDRILQRFPAIAGKAVFFAWGDIIYNPKGVAIPPFIVRHEEVHAARMRGDILGWWERYLDDDMFRLTEELAGHLAEIDALSENTNRQRRRQLLKQTARRLSNPIYGYRLTRHEATELLKAAMEND